MARTTEQRAKVEGLIPGLRVVGYHGRLGTDQTPARRAPVHADAENRLADIIEARRASSKRSHKAERGVTVQIMSRPIPDDVWTSTGTRIGPWPAQLGDVVVILGEREVRHASALTAQTVEGEPGRVPAFLRWLVTSERRCDQLQCERVGDLVAWYCGPEEASALWKRLAQLAREEVVRSARRGDDAELKKASFWLSRAAVGDPDIYLAAAGLRRASYRHWKALLDAGVQSVTEKERLAGVEKSLRELPIPAAPRSRTQRRAIEASFTLMEASTVQRGAAA